MSLLSNMPHTMDVYSRGRAIEELGGTKDSLHLLLDDRPCWRQEMREGEITEFEKRGIQATTRFYTTTDPQLDERHVIVSGGNTYEVQSRAVPDASAGLGLLFRTMARLTTTGSTG